MARIARGPDGLDTFIGLNGLPFVLSKMTFNEGFSQLFHGEIEAYVSTEFDTSARDSMLSDFLQQPCAVGLYRDEIWRYWHGMVTAFTQEDTKNIIYADKTQEATYFKIQIQPHLFVLTLRTNCRIFQNVSAADIIQQILSEHSILFSYNASAGAAERLYCVQYNETDFHFISRLMEEEGLFYFFTYTDADHTMMICDKDSAFEENMYSRVSYNPTGTTSLFVAHSLEESNHARIAAHKTKDFYYLNPQTNLMAGEDASNLQTHYSYPGLYNVQADGEDRASQWQMAQNSTIQKVTVRTNIPFLQVGFLFTIEGTSRSTLENVALVAIGIQHVIDYDTSERHPPDLPRQDAQYLNEVYGMDQRVPYVPLKVHPKPRIYGVQTAIVTGPEDEEIWTDEYGRVHVKFHWDLDSTEHDDTSCWMRVAQGWAGASWGILFTPRIGHEVLVSFENGDPDYPIITGCVYNEVMRPPYLPDNPTRGGIRTASSLDGDAEGQKFNEISLDDLSGGEQIFIHAQKDLDVIVHRGCRTELIEAAGDDDGHKDLVMNRGSRSATLHEGHDSLHMVKGNRTELLEEGDDSLTLEKGNWTIVLNEGNNEITLSQGDMVVSITGNQSTEISQNYTLDVTGDVAITVQGSTSLESQGPISIKSMQDVSIEGMNVNIKGQMNVAQEAGMEFSIAGMMVKMEAQMTLDLSGMTSTMAGQVMLELKALTTTVKADAILQLEAGAMMKGSAGVIMLG